MNNKIKLPRNFYEVAERYIKNELTSKQAYKEMKISRGRFFRYIHRFGYEKKPKKTFIKSHVFEMFRNGEIKAVEVSNMLRQETSEWYPMYKKYKTKKERLLRKEMYYE